MFIQSQEERVPGSRTGSDSPVTRRRRGRPRGATPQSKETCDRLYTTAIRLFAEQGYQETTLRRIASEAGVSVGLLYRYFPSKGAVVLALYDELSREYAARTSALPAGRWRDRTLVALRTSLEVLGPHRDTLVALVPLLVGSREEGLFARSTSASRERVSGAFIDAVQGAKDAPRRHGASLGRVLYLLHLGMVLWWLLDRSPRQRATGRLVALIERVLPSIAISMKLPLVRGLVRDLDQLVEDALLAPHAG